jgi:hypothetical protein
MLFFGAFPGTGYQIIEHAGTQFEPHIARVFVHIMDEGSIGEVDWLKELGWTTI